MIVMLLTTVLAGSASVQARDRQTVTALESVVALDRSAAAAATTRTSLEADARGVEQCYVTALHASPLEAGKVYVDLTIGARGEVDHATVKSFDDGLTSCVQQHAASWRFAAKSIKVRATFDAKLE